MAISLTGLYTGIYTTLATGLTTQVGGTVNPRIYNKIAPEGSTLPYVVFSQQAGGAMNINPSELADNIIFVRVWDDTDAGARSLFDTVDGLLDKKTLTFSGYTNIWCAREDLLDTAEEQPDGTYRYMYGGLYRIQTDN